MTVEENRGISGGEIDNFPVGMRVLAVDDDPTCLKLLDGLLRKCQYQVTITSQARMALKMLRENRNRFDLVISDVHMPDMDGFKLLERVGLEMDLPVIMLSANGDPKLVLKGITHGACDYLLKPVRIEELRNIWQHVIRRRKFDSKAQNDSINQDKDQQGSEGGQGPEMTGNTDQNGKLNRKRKDEEEEDEDSGHENEDPSAQKKPRVVWSIDLHRKFVTAVNQLGIEKAVPKRILDMMNVEGITRENVASHLQKYRLYLKRISSVASQQANMVAALGGRDASYLRMGSLDGFGDLRSLSGSGRLPNAALSSYPPSGMLGRLNSPASVNLRSLASSSLIQPCHAQNLNNSSNGLGKFQPVVSPANRNASLFQGIGPSNSLMLQGNPLSGGGFTNEPSLKVVSLNSESFNNGPSGSNFLGQGRCNENWQSAFQSSNTLPLSEPFSHDRLPPNSMGYNISSTGTRIQSNPIDFSSNTRVSVSLEDSRRECQEGLVGDIVKNMNQAPNHYTQNSNNGFNTLNSMVSANGIAPPLSQSIDQSNGVCNRRVDTFLVGRSNGGASTLWQHGEVEKSNMDLKLRSSEGYLLEQAKSQGGFVPHSYDSVDDLMSAVMKREQDGTMLMEGDFGFDAYSFGSCI